MNLKSIFESLGDNTKRTGDERQRSTTKRGPGRKHKDGHKKAGPSTQSGGAPVGFTTHVATQDRRQRRELIKAHGRRQALKQIKHERYAYKESNGDGRDDGLNTRYYESLEG